jgi:CDP-paratose 2-epimerase
MLEAISIAEEMTSRKLSFTISDQARAGDHIWWISDVRKFQNDYPDWQFGTTSGRSSEEIVDATTERSRSGVG